MLSLDGSTDTILMPGLGVVIISLDSKWSPLSLNGMLYSCWVRRLSMLHGSETLPVEKENKLAL